MVQHTCSSDDQSELKGHVCERFEQNSPAPFDNLLVTKQSFSGNLISLGVDVNLHQSLHCQHPAGEKYRCA